MSDALDRVAAVEANLDRLLAEARPVAADDLLDPEVEIVAGTGLSARAALDLFEDMVRSRVVDVVAREMKQRGEGFYTIGSAGHEHNAMLGAITRPTDPALLHYRSGGFYMARMRRAAAESGEPRNPMRDTLASIAATTRDPIARGRHKVWGSRRDWIIPQTSTIGSHPPKATGLAFAVDLARRVGVEVRVPGDAIVVCSFGDASVNHATTQAGINAARYSRRLGAPTPVLFVCEDNGLGISVPTPKGWVEDTFGNLKHLRYLRADGALGERWAAVEEAVAITRERRQPVFLHLPTVRLFGHAGSDVEAGYRTREEILAGEARDPLLETATFLLERRVATPEQLQRIVSWTRTQARALATEVASDGHLATAREVMASIGGTDGDLARANADETANAHVDAEERRAAFGGHLPEDATQPVKRTMAAHLNAALTDQLLRRPEMLVLGEDVGRKGGVYGVTSGLQKAFGQHRVFDTLLDETTVLGTAQGAALLGMLPVPEIQYLAYLHNAIDQLRGEAASMAFFSDGQFTNPMVVRVAGLAYQKGFGGHFHNDNALGAIREIPGVVLAVPSRGDDAVRMLRGSLALAKALARVVVFVEPIALYHERDLHREGDGGWLTDHPPAHEVLFPGEVGVHDEPGRAGEPALLMVTYGNGVRMSRRVARRLAEEHGTNVRVLDVRWLLPLAASVIKAHADACGHVLVVDECRASAGIGDGIVAALVERGYAGRIAAVRSRDSFVPLGPAADAVLLGEAEVLAAAKELVGARPAGLFTPQGAVPAADAATAPTDPAPEHAEPEPRRAEPEPVAAEPEPVAAEPAPEPEAAPEPEHAEPEPEPVAAEPEPEPVAAEPDPVPLAAEPEPDPEPVVDLTDEPAPHPEAAAVDRVAERGLLTSELSALHDDRSALDDPSEADTSEAGTSEAGTSEAGTSAAGTPDAGAPEDAGEPLPKLRTPPPFVVDPRTRPTWGEDELSEESVDEGPGADEGSAGGASDEEAPTRQAIRGPGQPPTSADDPLYFTAKGGRPKRRGR